MCCSTMWSPESQFQLTQSRIIHSMSDQPSCRVRYQRAPWFLNARTDSTSPMAPSRTRLRTSIREASRRSCVPVITDSPFGGGLLGRGQHRPHAGGVHRDGLFEEAVLAGGHRGGKMRRTEMWRRAMQHHVDTGIDQLQVSVKSREASAFGDVDALLFLQLLAAAATRSGKTSARAQ